MKKINLKKGFTLIELLVVISIISILSSVVISSLSGAKTRARNVTAIAQMREAEKALALYYADNNEYPPTTGGVTVNGIEFWCIGGTTCLYGGVAVNNLLALNESTSNNNLAAAFSTYLGRSNISFPTITVNGLDYRGIVYARVSTDGLSNGSEPVLLAPASGVSTTYGQTAGSDGVNQIFYIAPTGAAAPDESSGSGGSGMTDNDGDGVDDNTDNCVGTYNPNQADSDSNGTGDACDSGSGGGSI